jgi:hypothetical protein
MPVLADLRGLDLSQLNYNDVGIIAERYISHSTQIGGSPEAAVVSRVVDFGMVRMWEALSEKCFPVHKVFYAVDDAMRWLHAHRREASANV